ncbi:hypothetical protein [Flavonifractor plautii]|uniref:hypothetical protein n=1 Tax=Flavonifractor plautii TaxID=292800 RepID=UPI00189756D8|nr:hypothetical protein [Flavonifractor plautii]UQT47338.1 hypothetical protein M5E87_20195 [Flavonifractor plautii]
MSIAQRLQRLEAKLGEKRAWLTVFKLEDGSTFTTEPDPMTYLLKYGATTERGQITGYEPPPGTHDPITGAVYAEIRRLVLGEILAHPAPDRDIHDFG